MQNVRTVYRFRTKRLLYAHLVWQGGELPWVDMLSLQSRMDPEPKARLTTLIRERLEKAQSGASAAELQWFDDESHTIVRTEAARLKQA